MFRHLLSLTLGSAVTVGVISTPAAAVTMFDGNVASGWFNGGGNANGSFTINTENGVEVALRAKLRHNAAGAPENTFNSNGDGTYSFDAGVAPTQSSPTGVWSFEWSINTDTTYATNLHLDDLTYELTLINNVTGTSSSFDPINLPSPNFADHALADRNGTELTPQATSRSDYITKISENSVAQNSWKAHWFFPDYDPEDEGTYTVALSASDINGVIASTSIQILVPEPASAALLASGLGLVFARRRRN